MCGRYLLATRPDIITKVFGADIPAGIKLPKYNIAPGQSVSVLGINDPVPYHIHPKMDNTVFAFAGIFQFEAISRSYKFSIVTRASPPTFRNIHHRFPFILTEKEYRTWMDTTLTASELFEFL
jgi:putative SOS response-associated peptidase YedK